MHATYDSDHITVHFTARAERNDYGVPGSPVWYEPADIQIDSAEVLGVAVDLKTWPAELVAALHALADECEWHDDDA
jgi:hypothetical protein